MGGLVGENNGILENVYSNVSVSGKSYVGGLLGYQNSSGSVTNSYSAGSVNADSSSYGGLIGYNYGTVTSSYYNKNKSGCEDTDKGTSLTNAQMKDESNFEDWDFVSTWGVYDTINNGFPFLQAMSGEYEEENLDFWYSVKESKKGYVLSNQTMNIYYDTDTENTVKYVVGYVDQSGSSKSKEVLTTYDNIKSAFVGNFVIADGMREITSITAIIAGTNNKEVVFTSSFWYQMPLKVEGILNVQFNEDIIESTNMTLKVLKDNRCVYKTKLDGEATDIVHFLASGTDYRAVIIGNGIEYASINNIVVTQGQETTVDFSTVPKMASLNVEFYVDETELSHKDLKVVFYDRTEGKSRLLGDGTTLNYLSEGDVIGYSLVLSNELAKTYKVDKSVKTITLKAGKNTARLELNRFQNTSISGIIYENDGKTVVPGVKVTAVQQLNGIHSTTISGNTDASGKVSLTGKDAPTTITLSKKGYTTVSFEIDENKLNGFTYPMERAQGRIQFGISYIQSIDETETDISEEYNLMPDKVSIYNDTKDAVVTDVQNNWPNIYIGTKQASAGDRLSITIRKKGYAETVFQTTVSDNGNANVTGNIYQYGGIRLDFEREDGIANSQNHIIVFDGTGSKIIYKKEITSKCNIMGLESGSYTVISADENVPINLYGNLADLMKNTNISGLYSSKSVDVVDGMISTHSVVIPLTDEQEVYLNKENTSISLSNTNAMIGDSVVVRAEVAFKANAKRENTQITLNLPAGTKYVENSLTVDGKASDIAVENDEITIPCDTKTMVIRYRAKVLNTITSPILEFTGKVAYTVNGTDYVNSIGADHLNINELTLIVPKKARTNTIVARGITEKNAKILIYDGNIIVGNVTANKYGIYRTEINLTEDAGRIHYLKAVNKDTKAESETAQITCGNTQIDVSSFKVVHNGTTYDAGDSSIEVRNLNITMVPSSKFEFIATFTDNEVALVRTEIALTNGNVEIADMEYNDAMGYWHGEITLDSNRVPSEFNVSYLPLKYSHDYSEGGQFEMEASESDVVLEKHYDEADKEYVQILKHQFDIADAENNQIYEMTLLEDEADFELSDEYILTQIDGQDVYVNAYEIYGRYDGVDYSGMESYFKQEDGSYVRYIRAYGIVASSEKAKVWLKAKSSSTNEEKEGGKIAQFFKKLFKKSEEKVTEKVEDKVLETLDLKEEKSAMVKVKNAIDFIQRQTDVANKSKDDTEVQKVAKNYQDRMKVIMENGGPVAKSKASIYYHQLEAYVLLEDATKGIDWCQVISDQSIDLETASLSDKMLYKKVVTKTEDKIKEKLDDNYNAMKGVARSEIDKNFSALIKVISTDPDLLDALKELENTYAKARTRNGGGSKNQDDSEDGLLTTKKISTAKVSVDPSGYVYETFEDNRIQGVTATLYYENDAGDMEVWDAEEYNQKNPLITDNDGNYAWDVPEGLWQVVYTKEGYETVYSEKMVVPPPQLDVNIAMISTEPAHISKVTNLGDKLRITFDKYLLVDTILQDRIQLMYEGEIIDSAVSINKNHIRQYNDEQVTRYLEIQLKDGFFNKEQVYEIIVNDGLETYAGVPLGKDTMKYVVDSVEEPVNITIPDGVKVFLEGTEISPEDKLYQNDRIKIVADIPEGYRILSLKANDKEIDNESYVTVDNEDIVITVSYHKISDKNEYLVRFDTDGGSVIARQYVEEGGKVQKPVDPVKDGYDFLGWYFNDEKYDFNSVVTQNIVLRAKWLDKSSATESPNPTAGPSTTESPSPTDGSSITAPPKSTDVPNTTESPKQTDVPNATESPKPTDAPDATASPKPTDVPDATASPKPTNVPDTTASPKSADGSNATANPNPTEGANTSAIPLKGTVLQDNKNQVSYKVITQGKTVAFYRINNKKATKKVIPATVTINGIKYKVTAISDHAFSGCKKLKSVTIGKYITKIGKKAFYKCKKLKSITIKTKKLKGKSVGTKAFKGIHKKAVIKVPKKKKKAYKKWLKKKGITKKMKIK